MASPEHNAKFPDKLYWIVEDIEDSGVELTEPERTLLRGIKMFLRPTPQQYRLLFSLCERCGVDWKPPDKKKRPADGEIGEPQKVTVVFLQVHCCLVALPTSTNAADGVNGSTGIPKYKRIAGICKLSLPLGIVFN
jgi:hypothetical protein